LPPAETARRTGLYGQSGAAREARPNTSEGSRFKACCDPDPKGLRSAPRAFLPKAFACFLTLLPCIGYAQQNNQDTSQSTVDGKNSPSPLPTLPGASHLNTTYPKARPFEVTVNGSKHGIWVLLEHQGELYAPLEALIQWRLEPSPTSPPLYFRRLEYHALAGIPGYTSKADFANQSVELNFAPNAFGETRHGTAAIKRATTASAVPSLFLNYDINHQRTATPGSPTQQNLGLLGETGFSSPLGLFTSSFIGQQSSNSERAGNQSRILRLETTFTHDFPNSNWSLHFGDTATRMGMLGNSVYYGGFRFGTDFSLTPDFISQPLPIAKGVSSAPSTVELYVNNVLRQTTQVPSGPFAIENVPPMSGAGDIRMVVRDIFGRETVITRSFFSSNRLLAPGLSDWSLEGGRLRHDMGSSTSYYGEPFARGILRHGVNEHLTFEAVGETAGKQRNLQIGLSTPIGSWLGGSALATSQTQEEGSGHRWLASLEQTEMRYSISLQAINASEQYRSLGSSSAPTRRQLSANLSYATGDLGNIGFGFTSIRSFDGKSIDTQSATYSFLVGARGTLSFFASRSTGSGLEGTATGLTLVIPFDKGPVIVASANHRGRETDAYASATENPTNNTPFGWRTLVGRQQGSLREEAGVSYWGRHFQFTADASHNSTGMNSQRLSVGGNLVIADGELFALRESIESLALVEVPGYANVGVGLNNTNDRKTNANGVVLVPNLLSYQENSITLNAQDLPISAELDSIEQIAVPGRRSVVRVRFPVRSGQGALIKIALKNLKVAPAGSVARIRGDSRDFFVARRGEVFVTGLQPRNELILKHPEGECVLVVDVPPASPNKIPRLGPLECNEIVK